MRDDDFIQVVLVVSGYTEEVQFVALLIISDLETTSGSSLRSSTEKLQRHCDTSHTSKHTKSSVRPLATPLNHLFIPAHT